MKRPFVLATAAILLAHSLVGCCWHHAHASDDGVAGACAHDEHEHGHGPCAPDDDADHEHPSTTCHEGSCVFVRGEGPVSIEPSSILALDGFVVPARAIAQAELRIVHVEYSGSPGLAPPSRLHLLHQILQI